MIKEYRFESKSGKATIYARSFAPKNGNAKGIFQISHGMAEHCGRYDDFASFLSEKGYAVYINDHLGHGKSAESMSELGYLGEKGSWRVLSEDLKSLSDIAKNEYPDVPLFLFGHSMGSLIARLYCEKYGSFIDAAVFCGTLGENPAAKIGIGIASAIAARKGELHRSAFVDKLVFGRYNRQIYGAATKFDWLTRNKEKVQEYIDDPLCGFIFTAAGFRELFSLTQYVSSKTWYENVPLGLPMLLISGTQDPAGDYGKGVTQVYRELKRSGHGLSELKLYDGARHELLNELCKKEVYNDVADWANSIIPAKLSF